MDDTDQEINSLKNLDFTDIYVCSSDAGEPSYYNTIPTKTEKNRTLLVPWEYKESIDALVQLINKIDKPNFSIDFGGMRFRGVRLNTLGNSKRVVFRRFPTEVPNLDDQNFTPDVLRTFKSWGKRSGLIVIGGSTRAGKTTTACSILKYFLINEGQTAITIEDPTEFDMQGPYGDNGLCLQMPVDNEEDWSEKLKEALRAAPRYILMGEIRTAKAAANVLRASNSGHLVICTVHGGRLEETLGAIIQMALPELGEMAQTLLADGLLAVVHQKIEGGVPVNNILATTDSTSDPIRNIIKTGKLNSLSTEIYKQSINRQRDNSQQIAQLRSVESSASMKLRVADKVSVKYKSTPKKSWWKFW